MLSVGIVGLPNVGKSTLFQTLTKKQVDIQNYPFTTIEPNIGIVAVPDQRLKTLAVLSNSAKVVPSVVEFIDIAGLVKGAAQGEGLGNQFLSRIREVDAIVHIVRAFNNPGITHIAGAVDPLRDIEIINLELILADLQTLEKIIGKTAKEAKTGAEKIKKRLAVLEKIKLELLQNKTAERLALAPEEKESVKDINLITAKPTLIVLNIGEKTLPKDETLQKLRTAISEQTGLNERHIVISPIKLEFDLTELNEEEQKKYKQEFGWTDQALGLDQIISAGYAVLDLITFFTTGQDETRAWAVKRGAAAPEAGGKIHSDFRDKFIRAEVIPYFKFVKIGSWAKARDLGALKTVGKDYLVQDGDILEFKI